MKRLFRRRSVVLTVTLIVLAATAVFAERVPSRSPKKTATFWLCEYPVCVPLFYAWQGFEYVDFTRSGGNFQLQRIEHSVLMYGAGRTNPCNILLAISTDIYEDRGRLRLTTLNGGRHGDFLWSPNDLHWGRINDVSLRIAAPQLRGNARAASTSCFGGGSFTWSFNIP